LHSQKNETIFIRCFIENEYDGHPSNLLNTSFEGERIVQRMRLLATGDLNSAESLKPTNREHRLITFTSIQTQFLCSQYKRIQKETYIPSNP